MTEFSDRYDRNIRLFGAEGQRRLRGISAAIIGVGGLGSPLAQHLALLGVGRTTLVDDEELDGTNRNRFVGARHDDPVPGSPKVLLAARLIREINPDVDVQPIRAHLVSDEAFAAIKNSDVVFGCFDEDGPRAILNEVCAAYSKPYIDLASDVPEPGAYGGRICCAWDGNGCLHCLGELDGKAVERYLQSDEQREVHDRIYGIDKAALAEKGPSVSPLNGVVASLAAMEFMVAVTGLRPPVQVLNYRGHLGGVSVRREAVADCPICKCVRGLGKSAEVERYLSLPHLTRPRKPPVR